jgi:cytidyltransferase-like protein
MVAPQKKLVIVSGYFNPIHKGHLEYFQNARALGDELLVIVNSDHQRELKGTKEFQDENERLFIVSNIKAVDRALISVDQDRTVCATLAHIAVEIGGEYRLAFANGGDQNNGTIPERPVCELLGIELLDGLGDKIQSSSWLLNKG